MSTTLAGILIGVISFIIIIRNVRDVRYILIDLFALNLIYEGFVNVGFFVKVSSQTFKVPDFLQFAMAFFSILVLLRRRANVRLMGFIISILISGAVLALFPYGELVRTFNSVDRINNLKYMHYPSFDLQTVKTSVRLICFAVNATAITSIIDSEVWQKIKKRYFAAGRFVICYAWVEFFLKNIFHSTITEKIIYIIFGSDTSTMTALSRNGLSVIIGFNNEPSQFAMMLYSYLIIYIISKEWLEQSRFQKTLTCSSLLLMIVCGSFRAVAFLPILVVLYLIASEKPYQIIVVACVVSFGIIILDTLGLSDYYLTRLSRAFYFIRTGDTSIGGGEAGRLYTILEAFQVFLKRPIVGIGPGQTWAYGFIPSMLVMTGAVGLITWYNLIFGYISNLHHVVKRNKWLFMILVISISWIFTDSIAIGYSIYVMGIAFSIRFSNKNIV